MIDKTVEYYNVNAQSFFDTTVNADMSLQMEDFIKLLPADEKYLRNIFEDRFDIIEIRESIDVHPGREDEVWMNVFARKKTGIRYVYGQF